MQLQFDDIILNVRPHQVHEWALTTSEVAEGYGVGESTIRMHKQRNDGELIEGKHFVSVTNSDAVGSQATTYWTKRGVIRLGFFIKSERAKRFRDWAEDLTLKATEPLAPAPYHLPANHIDALQAYLDQLRVTQDQQLQLEAIKPKVEHYERTMNAAGSYSIADVAKMIGTGQNRLFEFLRETNVLFRTRSHNQPYQQYIDNGWFTVRQHSFQRGDKTESYPQLFVTPKGVEGIRKRWDAVHNPPGNAVAFLPESHGLA